MLYAPCAYPPCGRLNGLPYRAMMYRIAATALCTGFQMFPNPGMAYRRNVGSIIWKNPLDGMPRLALLSHRLIARGFPLDSCIPRNSRALNQLAGECVIRIASRTHSAGFPVAFTGPL